ncbi:solute carrier family 2, facilitated glucose transporter member 5-like isoform X2 [Aquila chrysaetos chrysaetos]|uniref:solute carrier family 2, facilitated glucose transporter member 5-like isoform X2 n=1 Tax=Aquila chrysaetos chrysaetos TaxID=223781 RepID=UPI001176FB87|nr:solute carrier family 2, facilitated glucose transporter member 5-like isoform X2 [Aquila chrysaetos chrysaetos]
MWGHCPAYGPRAHPRLEGTCGGSQRWQSITSVVPLPPGLAMAPQRAGRPGGAGLPLPLPPAGGGRPPDSSSGRAGASNEPRGHPGCLPCPAFPSLSPSFFHLKMGETSQAAGPGLPSSPPPPPPLSPRSGCSLAPTVGKGTPQPGGDITGHLTFPLLSVTFLVSFGSSMLYGYNLAVVNSPAVHIKAFYNATWSQRYGHGLASGALTLLYSLTVSIFALGGLVGSLLVGVLVERYGRNGALSRSTLLVLLAGGFMGFSRELGSPEMVIVGRSITGLHSGICLSVVPLYLGEIAPKNLRGFLGLMPSIFICLGVFFAQVLGLPELLGEDRFWPLFLSVVVIPASLQLLLLHCFPESPRYLLIERNDVCGATKALRQFLGTPDVQDVIEEMKEEQRSLSSVEMVSVWQLLRDRSVRWQTLSVVVVNAGMQLSGIDAIWFYTNTIFENAGIPVSQIPYTTVGTGTIEVVAGLIGCFTIEKLGRRPLIITGFCAMGICSAGITVSLLLQTTLPWMHYVSVACVVGIIAGFCMGPAGVPFLMTAELFTQSHRPAAYIVGGSLNWLCNFTVGFIFPFLQMSAGAFCYLVFCGVCLLVALYVYLVVPETKNKTFMEISHIFATRRSFLSIPAHLIGMTKLSGYGALESSSLEGSGSSLP